MVRQQSIQVATNSRHPLTLLLDNRPKSLFWRVPKLKSDVIGALAVVALDVNAVMPLPTERVLAKGYLTLQVTPFGSCTSLPGRSGGGGPLDVGSRYFQVPMCNPPVLGA
jgi:hypothetical protein